MNNARHLTFRLAPAIMLAALASSATGQNGNPRLPFSSVDGKSIIIRPVEKECWVMGGNATSLFGLSRSHDEKFGILFSDDSHNPILKVNVLVAIRGSFGAEPTAEWTLPFENLGTTNNKDYIYRAYVERERAEQLLGSAIITFTGIYETAHGVGHIGKANKVNFTQRAIDELKRCADTFD